MHPFRLQLFAALAALSSTAVAQVLVGTAPGAGSASPPQIFHVDVPSGMATGNLWGGVSSMGMAADDVGRVVYTSIVGAGNIGDLYQWSYGDVNPPILVGRITDVGSNSPLRLEGLTWANGALHAVQLSGTTTGAPQAIFRINLTTLTATVVYTFANSSINVSGLGFNPTNGRFYCPNDGAAYPGGLGIVEVDPVAQTEVLIAPYPAGRTDIDGCAVDPAGFVFLVEDETSSLHIYDLNTGSYIVNPPANPVTVTQIHSGAAWAPSLFGPATLGTSYCAANVNSTGATGSMAASGSASVAASSVTLAAGRLPTGAFAFFLTSRTQGFIANPGGSQGNLCLGGSIGRFVGPGQIQSTGATGSVALVLNLAQMPQPTGFVAVAAGDTWNFTCWHRDLVAGAPTSNFANGLSIDFVP